MRKQLLFLVVQVSLLMVSRPVSAQRGWISGTVVDSLGVPVKYANIIVSDSDSWFGMMTDDKGAFRFEVPVGRHVLKARTMGYADSDRNVTVRLSENVSVQFALRPRAPEPAIPQQVVVSQGHTRPETAEQPEELEPLGTYHPRSKPVRLGALELTLSYVQSQEGDSVRTRIVAEARNVSDQPVTTCGCFSFWKVSCGFGPEVLDSIPLGGHWNYRGPVLKVGPSECTTPRLDCRDESLPPGKTRTHEMSFSFRAADFKMWTNEVDITCIYYYGNAGSAWEDTKFVRLTELRVPVRPIGTPYQQH
jgi:hypothetical protein